jgi:hypothetical protein
MPRAAVLSIHARVADVKPDTWAHPVYEQVWGPRYSAYVVAARDRALFTLGRLPDDARGRLRAEQTAERLRSHLGERRAGYGIVGQELGVNANSFRYASPTGTLVMRWEGARQPVIWMVPPPKVTPHQARLELARRYIRIFGPTTASAFADWAGIGAAQGRAAFEALRDELVAVESPIGTGWILAVDETSFRDGPSPAAAARLLPSGDTFFLLWGADRELLVPDASLRQLLWTSRVWPGAVLVDGEVAGTWRRDQSNVSVEPWRAFTTTERHSVEAEAASLPLPGLTSPISVSWSA